MSTFEGGQYVLLVKSSQIEQELSDKGDTSAPISEVCDPVDKDATEANSTVVEEHIACDTAELDLPPLSILASSGIALAREESQDSILDVEGCCDDEVSLIEWGSQENNAFKGSPTLREAAETTAAE